MNYCSNTAAARPTHTFPSRLHGLTACVLIMVFASAATADEISATAAMENPDNPLFLLSTSRGNIYIEMLPEEAPANTANVMALAQGEIELTDEANDFTFQPRYYDGMRFHRVIPGFVIQTGSPAYHSLGAPEAVLDDEISAATLQLDQEPLLNIDGSVNELLQITDHEEFGDAVLNPLYASMGIDSVDELEQQQFNVLERLKSLSIQDVYELQGYDYDDSLTTRPITRGIVAMANRGPNTNGPEFFVALADLPSLTGKYTVIGQVVEGMEVVDQIGSVPIEAQQFSRNSSVIYSFEQVNQTASSAPPSTPNQGF